MILAASRERHRQKHKTRADISERFPARLGLSWMSRKKSFLKLYRLGRWHKMEDERAYLSRMAWRISVERLTKNSRARQTLDAEAASDNVDARSQMQVEVTATPLP
jgi:hypothetical protein